MREGGESSPAVRTSSCLLPALAATDPCSLDAPSARSKVVLLLARGGVATSPTVTEFPAPSVAEQTAKVHGQVRFDIVVYPF